MIDKKIKWDYLDYDVLINPTEFKYRKTVPKTKEEEADRIVEILSRPPKKNTADDEAFYQMIKELVIKSYFIK